MPLKQLLSEKEHNEKNRNGKVHQAGQYEVAATQARDAAPSNQCSCQNKPGTTGTSDCRLHVEEPQKIGSVACTRILCAVLRC